MIAVSSSNVASETERSQLERKDLAIGAWREGQVENALLIVDEILSENLSPRVAAECYVAQAAFRQAQGDFAGSMESLRLASPFIDSTDQTIQGAFYHQRGRAYKAAGNIDAALTDYSGASVCWSVTDDPRHGAVLNNLAGLYLLIGDLPSARSYIEKAFRALRKKNPLYLPQAYDTLANIEIADGRLEHAAEAIRQAFLLVGENEVWRQTFLETRDKIGKKIEELSGTLHSVNVEMVRWALIRTGGNLTQTGKLTGLTHKGVSYIVDRHPELEQFRTKRRTRTHLKSVFKEN